MPVTQDNQYIQAERLLPQLKEQYAAGVSTNALAKQYGLRREAIATVLTTAGVIASTEGRERVLAYVRKHRGVSLDEVVEALKIPKTTVSRYLRGTDEQAMVVTRKKTDYKTYSDEQKLAALKEAWEQLDEDQRSKGLSRVRYDRLVGSRDDRPSSVTFVRQYGSWSAACEAAGIAAAAARRSSYEREYDDDAIVDGIRRFINETGRTSFHAYAAWAKENGEASGPLVIIRLGSWRSARERVIEFNAAAV